MRLLLPLILLAACSETLPEPSAVLLDPEATDLGVLFPTQGGESKVVVADIRGRASAPILQSIEVSGAGAEWVTVRPIVPVPTPLSDPIPVELEARIPEQGAESGAYTVDLLIRGVDGEEPFELSGRLTFDVGLCDQDADTYRRPECGGNDCDDEDPTVNPDSPETCNGVDDDCNGLVDDADDGDGDGANICLDCNDLDPLIRPGAPERCNGLDDNCDGELGPRETDSDNDGFFICSGDCNDRDNRVFPGALERCNGIDDDCDGLTDDREDQDGDSFSVCEDCNDRDRAIYPGAPERCNGLDDDCDGELPASEADADGDGVAVCDLDCDDSDAGVFPGAMEACNGLDDDCDEDIDEAGACPCDRVVDDGDVYLFCTSGRDWPTAQRRCAGWNYHLLTIDDSAEDEFAFAEIRDRDASRRWWMGYNDRRREGVWEWEDGTPSGYENWGGGEPNDTGAGEDCGQLNRYTDGGWNDEPCANSLPFVCELD